MNTEQALQILSKTLTASVSPYHCIKESKRQLDEASFHPLSLTKSWNLAAATTSLCLTLP